MKVRQAFEKELKTKLALKSDGKQSEESIALRAFKYFDLDNSGTCSKTEWTKAMAKLGITGFSDKQLEEVFQTYDIDKNEHLDYKEFSESVFSEGKKEKGGQKEDHDKEGEVDEETRLKLHNSKIMEKFRDRILERGGKGIIGLARQFKIFDDNNSGSLSLEELTKAIRDFRVDLSKDEIKILFNLLDTDNCGEVKYDEFLREIRGDMNQRRKKLVDQAFSKLDHDGSGVVELEEIKKTYNVKRHPDVISGKKTEDEAFLEFMETFQQHAANKGKGTKDSKISRDEFQEYYENISASIDNDDYFELMMTNAWKLGERPKWENQKAWTNKEETKGIESKTAKSFKDKFTKGKTPYGTSDEKIDKSLVSTEDDGTPMGKLRASLSRRGVRGIMSFRRSFMIADDDNSKTIDFGEFKNLCKTYRIALDDQEIKKCFSTFDRDRSGIIDYEEFVSGIVGKMNKRRKTIVKKAFDILDKNKNGKIELDDIRGTYNAKSHPEVKAGKKTEDEVLAEWLDTFEYHFNLLNENKSKNRSINEEEFEEYYNNISMSIENDEYFEAMMTSAWNLDGKRVTKKGWKGEI